MTIVEAMQQTAKKYIADNGIGVIVTKQELYSAATTLMTINPNSFLPADYCYNRIHNGIPFDRQIRLFEILDDGKYKIFGENYPYTGPAFCRSTNGKEYIVKGFWTEGKFDENIPKYYDRLIDLFDSLSRTLTNATVHIDNKSIMVYLNNVELCSVLIMDEAYKISTGLHEWKEKTSYLCSDENQFLVVYYVDTIDECLGEIDRLFRYASKKTSETDPINWENGVESVLSQLSGYIEKAFDGTEYSVQRNTTKAEKNLDIFKRGEPTRCVQIWPKVKSKTVEICVTLDIFSSLKAKMILPQDYDVKPGRYPGLRKFKNLEFKKAMIIISAIAK